MAIKPQIIIDDFSGTNISPSLIKYKDASTICIIPTRGQISAKVVQNWWAIIPPMNQKFIRIFVVGMEVGAAYSTTIEQILAHPVLSKWKFILTLEEDNMPPPDGLIKLLESTDKFDAIGGLYWTKGEMGQPMVYGDPKAKPLNFVPQIPRPDSIHECNGLGMGFTLFKMDIFRNPKLCKPFFKTLQEYIPGLGVKNHTQDLYFFENIKKLGYKVACDTRVKVGHYDAENDIVW